jgi:Carboxypeptidase regulatory-like domain
MRIIWFFALCAFLSLPSFAKDKNKNNKQNNEDEVGPVSTLNFVVLKDDNGKPVRSAAVILHEVGNNGKQEKGGLELKTDLDGKATYEGVPYGKFRVQVIATGFQTFGGDYDVNQATMNINIKMKRPESQFSVYENHPDEKKDEQTKPQ